MKIVAIVKLVIGLFLLLGVLNGVKNIAVNTNAAQMLGYLMVMALFLLSGIFLTYSGIRGLQSQPK